MLVEHCGIALLMYANKQKIGDVGGVELIHGSMKKHHKSTRLQQNACEVLGSLAVNDINQQKIVNAGGIDLISTATKNYPSSTHLLKEALQNVITRSWNQLYSSIQTIGASDDYYESRVNLIVLQAIESIDQLGLFKDWLCQNGSSKILHNCVTKLHKNHVCAIEEIPPKRPHCQSSRTVATLRVETSKIAAYPAGIGIGIVGMTACESCHCFVFDRVG